MLTACSALALAACGGEGGTVERQPNPGPPIERSTAEQLAVRSDELARLLEAGDNCGAIAEGARLREELNAAINRGVIPEVYLEDLSGVVNEIQEQIPICEEAVQVPPPPRDGDEGKKDREGDKDKKKDADKKRDEDKKKDGDD